MRAEPALKTKARDILSVLKREYPHSGCSLEFKNPFELLIGTILSAQCTDERVNQVAKGLFRKYPSAEVLAKADLKEIEEIIRPAGFYRNKAKSLKACSEALVKDHGGEVPDELEDLVKLRGVGRKTANVVLGNAFGKPAVVIETHVIRLAERLALSRTKDPVKMEFEFMEIFPKKGWIDLTHYLMSHGRAVCKALKPRCEECNLTRWCDFYQRK